MTSGSDEAVRLDVWLDVACLFKTRSEAQKACKGGKIDVNGQPARQNRLVRAGDEIEIGRPLGRQQKVEDSSRSRPACRQGGRARAVRRSDAAADAGTDRDAEIGEALQSGFRAAARAGQTSAPGASGAQRARVIRDERPRSTAEVGSVRTPGPAVTDGALFRPIADVAARRASPLPVVPRPPGFRTGSARHPLGDVARSCVIRTIVARTADHRFIDILVAAQRLRVARCRRGVDIA